MAIFKVTLERAVRHIERAVIDVDANSGKEARQDGPRLLPALHPDWKPVSGTLAISEPKVVEVDAIAEGTEDIP